MDYQFPKNLHLDEVRAAIAAHNERLGTKAFIEADRGNHVIFNYLVAFADSFPHPSTGDIELDRQYAILRECRGLTFCKETGRVANRKFAKFFNINEKPETQVSVIDWSRPHVIFEKLDGSMITPIHLGSLDDIAPETLRWCTKMGMTDVAKPVEEWVAQHPNYAQWAAQTIRSGFTVIFEWCSRQQRIVIDYPRDRLVLTAIRDNATGEYLSHAEMLKAENHGIEVVRALDGSIENIEQFMSETRDLEGAEGYVIRFDDGHMLKVKGAWYCQIHKTKELLNFEKDVFSLILSDHVDDAKAFMSEEDRDRIDRFSDALFHEVDNTVSRIAALADIGKKFAGEDRKKYATEFVPNQAVSDLEKKLLFNAYSGHDIRTAVLNTIGSYTASGPRIEVIRHLINGLNWNDYRDHSYCADD